MTSPESLMVVGGSASLERAWGDGDINSAGGTKVATGVSMYCESSAALRRTADAIMGVDAGVETRLLVFESKDVESDASWDVSRDLGFTGCCGL